MDSITTALQNINYLAVLVAVLSTFVVGFVWYAKWAFGNIWMKSIGLTDEDLKDANMGQISGGTFILSSIAAIGLAILLSRNPGLMNGVLLGGFIGAVFIGAQKGVNSLFERKPLSYWLVSTSHDIVAYMLMGAIIGAWQ